MEQREPIIERELPEPEPQRETASAGGVRPPGRIGGGLRDDEGSDEQPGGPIEPRQFDPNVFNMPIENLNLSMRAYNCLRRSGFRALGDVVSCQPDDLLSLRNFGWKSFDEVRERISEIVELRAPRGSDLTPGSIIRVWLERAAAVPSDTAAGPVDAEWQDFE